MIDWTKTPTMVQTGVITGLEQLLRPLYSPRRGQLNLDHLQICVKESLTHSRMSSILVFCTRTSLNIYAPDATTTISLRLLRQSYPEEQIFCRTLSMRFINSQSRK